MYYIEIATFLSCLFGSEPARLCPGADNCFLSCLFGSEPLQAARTACAHFLSCLFGSERAGRD